VPKRDEIQLISWDLVAIDEAHKLRNVYRSCNKMGKNILQAVGDRRKILLTATPLQNSLLDVEKL
jgi:SNF2 family DNA or RNA helicase